MSFSLIAIESTLLIGHVSLVIICFLLFWPTLPSVARLTLAEQGELGEHLAWHWERLLYGVDISQNTQLNH